MAPHLCPAQKRGKSESVSCSVVSDSASSWIVAHQLPLSMGFSRQEYWSGLSFPPPGDLPNRALAGSFLTTSAPRKPILNTVIYACQSQSPNPSHIPHFPLGIHKCSLHLCLYFCFANKLICTIFLDSTYKLYHTMFFSFENFKREVFPLCMTVHMTLLRSIRQSLAYPHLCKWHNFMPFYG